MKFGQLYYNPTYTSVPSLLSFVFIWDFYGSGGNTYTMTHLLPWSFKSILILMNHRQMINQTHFVQSLFNVSLIETDTIPALNPPSSHCFKSALTCRSRRRRRRREICFRGFEYQMHHLVIDFIVCLHHTRLFMMCSIQMKRSGRWAKRSATRIEPSTSE